MSFSLSFQGAWPGAWLGAWLGHAPGVAGGVAWGCPDLPSEAHVCSPVRSLGGESVSR